MNGPTDIPALERPAFANGQRLLAADMTALFAYQRAIRWLHNRALHPWGIGAGFAVDGRKGGREVTIEPGYALDCAGRDIVLSSPRTLQVPAVVGAPAGGPAEFYLTASYAEDAELAVAEHRGGVCDGGGAIRRIEAPRIRWQNPRDVSDPDRRFRRGLDLILASVEIEDCRLARAPSGKLRRSARLATRPHLASGRTAAGATDWRFFPPGAPLAAVSGVETDVDTTAAGFQTTPTYLADVAGSRLLAGAAGGGTLAAGFTQVAEPTAAGFRLRVFLPRSLHVGAFQLNPPGIFVPPTLQQLRNVARWHVEWIGLEG